MPLIIFQENSYESIADETVLDCLKRHNVDYPCACQSGVCQSCLAQLTFGTIEPTWQKGLKETLVAKNYFLACLAKPVDNITLILPGLDEVTTPAKIKQVKYFNDNIICLRLSVSHPVQWIPGQYVNLINPEGCRRSYSIANVPEEDDFVELHIKLLPNGIMSEWIKSTAFPGIKIHLQGPIGNCFYANPAKEDFPIVLVGTGTGLAPLLAITRDAMRKQHKGKITLLHGGVYTKDLYLDEQLKQLAQQHQQLTYESCVLKGDELHQEISIDKMLLKALENNTEARVYVCGTAETTKRLKKIAFIAGVSSTFIYSDTFIASGKSAELET